MTYRAQEIFEQTVDLPVSERGKVLDEACAGDVTLRDQVESLLAANDQAGSFMGSPTVDHLAAYSEPAEQAGTTIGRYKLLEKIGQGGFGDVYMAQQVEPVKRRVAFKIIKLGMDTKQVVARFEAERQALALMDHPHIASVLDGGETNSGRPYFVMELVRGDPITEYCDREKLSTRQRLKLFQQVCQAIQHAHQKGVIHRDIKPNNVLVTVADGQPLVKVIDFGIAKATNTQLTEKTLFTEFRQLIGTPQYMSPEQAERSGVDVDTRSDIYSLGVLLYEILTGQTPVDPTAMKSAVWEELQRMIREDEPTRPSMLVTSMGPDSELIAKSRGTEPARLGTLLRGDLDWIVLKALEKDRTRRYGTASELSDDVQRYLSDEAVTATPPSTTYKLRKLVRRNRAAIAVALALTVALLVGLVSTTLTSIWAMRERDKALQAKQIAVEAEKVTRDASRRADQQAERARRMVAMVGNSFQQEDEANELARAWLADIERFKRTGELAEKEILIQECQLATWWFYHQGGSNAIKMIEQLYDRAKAQLGPSNSNFLTLVNTNIVAHINKYDASRIADLYGDLMRSLRVLRPAERELIMPQFAAALHQAGRDDETTEVISEYLAIRRGPRPYYKSPVLEKSRLRLGIRDLEGWGEHHPRLFAQLKAHMTRLTELEQSGNANARQIWEGTLEVDGAKLRLRFDVTRSANGEFSGKMISIGQNQAEVPLSKMTFAGGVVTMEFREAQAEFVGKLNEQRGDQCVGKWKQLGNEHDLTIRRIQPTPD